MLRQSCLFFAMLVVLVTTVSAEPITLQGRIDGVADGQYNVTLDIWDAASGGSLVATDTVSVGFAGGVFTIEADVSGGAFNGDRWWSLSVPGVPTTDRVRVASVPRSLSTRGIWVGENGGVSLNGLQFTNSSFAIAGAPLGPAAFRLYNSADPLAPSALDLVQSGNGPSGASRWTIFSPYAHAAGFSSGPDAQIVRWNGQALVFGRTANNLGAPAFPIGIGVEDPSPQFALTINGATETTSLTINGGSDLAEPFPASADGVTLVPGMVLSIDPEHPGALRASTEGYDRKVAGVYSGGNGLPTGLVMGKDGCELTGANEDTLPLAMTGRVWVFADESNGAIEPGDRLTTSAAKPGYAMKATDSNRSDGAVIGKAMTPIDEESGMVLVLVNLQ